MSVNQNTLQLEQYQYFLNLFKEFSESQENNKIQYYQTNYKTLLKNYFNCKRSINELLIKEADEFNIFQILGVEKLEARTHTPFLVNLLNPQGTHAQGKLFYKHFIHTLPLASSDSNKLLNIEPDDLEVIGEKAIPGGFIDIFIYHRKRHNRFCVIIENKLYAGDQDKQLERYYNYAKEVINLPVKDIYLIYLKDGREATYDSMSKAKQAELKGNLLNISYSTHINDLLSNALVEVKAENVKLILHQYINTIKNLNL